MKTVPRAVPKVVPAGPDSTVGPLVIRNVMSTQESTAKRAGRKVQVIGVEGDRDHVAFATDACRLNGLVGDEVRVVHGIAAATAGTALFPRQDIGGHNYGLEPVFGATEEQRTRYLESGKYDELPMVGLDHVIGAEDALAQCQASLFVGVQDGRGAAQQTDDIRAAIAVKVDGLCLADRRLLGVGHGPAFFGFS